MPPSMDAATARELAVEAYVFCYPLVLMELTRRQMTNLPADVKPGVGPGGRWTHVRAFPPAEFKAVVRPNFDTLYSIAWVDVGDEPWIMSAPDSGGRCYLLPLYDMWSDAFAVPGSRTTGTGAGAWAIVHEDWHGELPAGVERIETPTPQVWIIGRTQTNGVADYPAVHAFQDGFGLVPLSGWGTAYTAPPFVAEPTVDMTTPPMVQADTMAGETYFTLAAELMKHQPPHLTDWSAVARMRRIGLVPGQPFELASLDATIHEAIEAAPAEANARMKAVLPTLAKVVNGWSMNTDTMGVYGDAYLKRAVVAMAGLGANQVVDAIYPMLLVDADGKPLDGGTGYVIHFDADQLPPVEAFWSITMYDAEGFQAANELDRFAIGDRDALTCNADGSLDIQLRHTNPGGALSSNWLPSPLGPLGVTMRLYSPKAPALDGRWAPPAVRKV